MTDLEELAKRVEALSGPSFDIDHEIHDLLGDNDGAPLYTRSLDAAVALVPEGLCWCVDTYDERPRAFVEPRQPYDGQPFWGKHESIPCLALCAAALRARSAK